ncbi:hypothetical protein GUITHDRAFT_108889 [Guillardia theta CCMP2712]|uniref:Uncharacterized protein n=1 Tax=Guillardia theta (strain CCMP2712) TaxID=905079 RepID=L1JAY2_GUITC|nr:hypothetical protein GUITHDRAFT_108889 [Guillardia theta CCMP2712]EKX45250.1 hypothetical protein GUITHDRAFT_108889 [Guillardia theta CCMP2712]|eukprot:XP_005832230.1 hypothetical protein GUITHDRAFT_108889 [Guillardia theta CCMP2712]
MVFTDTGSSMVRVLDLDDGKVEKEIDGIGTTPAAIYPTSDYKSVVVNFRALHEFFLVHSGLSLESHGDHADVSKSDPTKFSIEGKCTDCKLPTHFSGGYNRMVIFFDGTSAPQNEPTVRSRAVAIDDRLSMLADTTKKTLDSRIEFDSTWMAPQHGIAVPLAQDVFLVSLPNPAFNSSACATPHTSCDSLSSQFKAVKKTASGNVDVAWNTPRDCPGYHGHAMGMGGWHAIGCGNGRGGINLQNSYFLAVKYSNDAIESFNVKYHEAGGSIGTFVGHDNQAVLVGVYNKDGSRSFVRWRGGDKSYTVNDVMAVPAGVIPVSYGFEMVSGKVFVAFYTSGEVKLYDVSSSWKELASLKVVEPFTSTSKYQLVLGYHKMYLLDPDQSKITEIDIKDDSVLSTGRSFTVTGKPTAGVVIGMTPMEALEAACGGGEESHETFSAGVQLTYAAGSFVMAIAVSILNLHM